MNHCRLGFHVLGAATGERRLSEAAAAFAGYAACDPRAQVEKEAYLSALQYAEDFRDFLTQKGSVKGFAGICWSPVLWFDIDRENDLEVARRDAAKLVGYLDDRYQIPDSDSGPLVFYSGSKGYHVGLSTGLMAPEPSVEFHRYARQFAEAAAARAGVPIDTGVYDKVRCFRAPNSRHPKTGRYKRRLSFEELAQLDLAVIRQMAENPEPFEVPSPLPRNEQAVKDWQQAEEAVRRQQQQKHHMAVQRSVGEAVGLNRQTLEFIRNGAAVGDRHRLLFSAAANLAEFGCPPALALALLEEAALDSGLSPSEVKRQIDCGLTHVKGGAA